MDKYKRPSALNLDEFSPDNTAPHAKYGLPNQIRFCKTCVISNQRPNSAQEFSHTSETLKTTTHINKQGICDACRFADEKKSTNQLG